MGAASSTEGGPRRGITLSNRPAGLCQGQTWGVADGGGILAGNQEAPSRFEAGFPSPCPSSHLTGVETLGGPSANAYQPLSPNPARLSEVGCWNGGPVFTASEPFVTIGAARTSSFFEAEHSQVFPPCCQPRPQASPPPSRQQCWGGRTCAHCQRDLHRWCGSHFLLLRGRAQPSPPPRQPARTPVLA